MENKNINNNVLNEVNIINEYIPKCEYCNKPYKKYYKKELVYCEGVYDETRYNLIEDYKPDCMCNFMHLSDEKKVETILLNLGNSRLSPKLLRVSFKTLKQTKELKACRIYAEQFIKENKKGLRLIGNPGNGKTTALACICKYLIESGYRCYFSTLSTLLRDYSKHAFDNNGMITDKLEELNNFDLIILDDIGRESLTPTRAELFFNIIDYLINYEIKLAFSCNPEMFEKIEKRTEFKAIIDRFNELCPNVIYFNGETFRGK